MFSSDDVRLFFSNPTPTDSRVVYPLYRAHSEWQQCFFLQAGPGCIHGVAASSYITAHLNVVVEYQQG